MAALKSRITKLEKSHPKAGVLPKIQYLGWDDDRGSFAAFIPGRREPLEPEFDESEDAFRARAEAIYSDIQEKCNSMGLRPRPEDPFKDVLKQIASEGRTVLSDKIPPTKNHAEQTTATKDRS